MSISTIRENVLQFVGVFYNICLLLSVEYVLAWIIHGPRLQ